MEITQDIQFITNNTGQKTFAIIPIDQYNSYVEYEKMLKEKEDFFYELSEQDLEDIKTSEQELELGLGINHQDLVNEIREYRERKWK